MTSIGDWAFFGCRGLLTSINIPDGVTSIGKGTFWGCSGLISINIPNSVTSIGDDAFSGCSDLRSINIPNSVTSIANGAFFGCRGLTSINIPNSITSIGDGAFSGCSRLTSVFITDIAAWCGIKFLSVESNPLYYAHNLYLNNELVTNLVIPCSVTSIGSYAFAGCNNLKKITSFAINPPNIKDGTFEGISKNDVVVKVPEKSILKYKSADYWSEFLNIEGINTSFSIYDNEDYSKELTDDYDEITYTRTFNNTNLQALYVPFSMSYNDWCNDFDVYRINGFYEYDRNDDGLVDEHLLEVIRVTEKNGSLKPNYPYLIKAKTAGEKTITLKNATLYAAETNSIDCSTVDTKYTFTGTYDRMNGLKSAGYYCLSNGKLCPAANDDVTLGAFRWYLKVESRGAQFVSAPAKIMVRIKGEDATGIEEVGAERSVNDGKVFSLDGRLMDSESLPGGIYIKNGKKFIIK